MPARPMVRLAIIILNHSAFHLSTKMVIKQLPRLTVFGQAVGRRSEIVGGRTFGAARCGRCTHPCRR